MSGPDLLTTLSDEVAILQISNPAKLNAWTTSLRDLLRAEFARAESDPAVRAVVITGAGDRAFCAGQDLAESVHFVDGSWVDEMRTLFDQIRRFPKPVVAAVNGVAAGSGFQLALLCDVRVGWAGTRMGQTELNHDIPSITGTWFMVNEIGFARSRAMVLLGSVIYGEEAYRLRFLDELVGDHDAVLTRSIELARSLGRRDSDAFRTTKDWLRTMSEPGFVEAFEEGRRRHTATFTSGSSQAGIRRFLERQTG